MSLFRPTSFYNLPKSFDMPSLIAVIALHGHWTFRPNRRLSRLPVELEASGTATHRVRTMVAVWLPRGWRLRSSIVLCFRALSCFVIIGHCGPTSCHLPVSMSVQWRDIFSLPTTSTIDLYVQTHFFLTKDNFLISSVFNYNLNKSDVNPLGLNKTAVYFNTFIGTRCIQNVTINKINCTDVMW